MAKKEQILLENIFDAACVIEESFFGKITHAAGKAVRKIKNVAQNTGDYAKGRINDAANFVADKTKTTMADRMRKSMGSIKDFASDKAYDIKSKMSQLHDNLNDQARAVGQHVNANKTAYGAGLLGLGAAGAGAYALHDKLGNVADDTGEAMHSLRDKIANLINAHHEA
jgi:gas vesicle protein